MTDILILYASTHGHTAKIAARIARTVSPRPTNNASPTM